jgi:uncharacterized protein (TIRG00374 family)
MSNEPEIAQIEQTQKGSKKKNLFHPSSLILHPLTLRLVGTALLIFFLWKLNLDLGKVWTELSQANLWFIGASVLLVFPFIALKAWRWQVILRDVGIRLSFSRAYRIYALGLAAGSFTPGQAGDFLKAWELSRAGHALGSAFLSAVLDRLFDVAVLVLLAASGLLVLGADFSNVLPGLIGLLAGVIAALVVLSVPTLRARLLDIALKMARRKKIEDRVSKIEDQPPATSHRPPAATNAPSSSFILHPSSLNFIFVFLLTLAASGLALVRVWLLALALGLNLGLMETVAASSLATVVSLLPISVAGIGARDVALVVILGRLGYSTEKAISLSSFILLLTLVNLIAGYAIWYTRDKDEG